MIDPIAFAELRAVVGEPRFATYLSHYDHREDLALRLYLWNASVSAALWGPLHMLEVTVRNAIHEKMTERESREDWWNSPTIHLMERERDTLDATLSKLRSRGNKSPSANDIVAATSFGLWTGLTSEGIPRDRLLSYETTFWQPRLRKAFPHYRGTRKSIHAELDDIRKYRNRIAHHEPIFRADLRGLVEKIERLVGYVSKDVEQLVFQGGRVREIIASQRDYVEHGRCSI